MTANRSQPFAFLIPLSPDAAATLNISTNRVLVHESEACHATGYFVSSYVVRGRSFLIQLDFAAILGCRYLAVGSSPLSRLQLLSAPDIAEHHFLLHFEMNSARLCLTDASLTGTWVLDQQTQQRQHLQHATTLLPPVAEVTFGREQRYRFCLVLARQTSNLTPSGPAFQEYCQTISHEFCRSRSGLLPAPSRGKRRRSRTDLASPTTVQSTGSVRKRRQIKRAVRRPILTNIDCRDGRLQDRSSAMVRRDEDHESPIGLSNRHVSGQSDVSASFPSYLPTALRFCFRWYRW